MSSKARSTQPRTMALTTNVTPLSCVDTFFPRDIFTLHFYRPLPRPWGVHACVKSASILTTVEKDCCHLSTETSPLTPSSLVSVGMAKGVWGNLSKSVVLNGRAGGSDFALQGTFGNVQRDLFGCHHWVHIIDI